MNAAELLTGNSVGATLFSAKRAHAAGLGKDPMQPLPIAEKFNSIGQSYLINKLNYINFQGGSILIACEDCGQHRLISLPAKPQSIAENRLECSWIQAQDLAAELDAYRFKFLLVPDEEKLLRVEANLLYLHQGGIGLQLPEACSDVSRRQLRRYKCQGVRARLIHQDKILDGLLSDYAVNSFRVDLANDGPARAAHGLCSQTFDTQFTANGQILYAGPCQMVKQYLGRSGRVCVLTPLSSQFARLEPKEYRSERQVMVPPPDAVFKHPLTGKLVQLKVLDVSGVGFSVEDFEPEAVVFPGLRIPELQLRFVDGFTVHCRALVVHRGKPSSQDNGNGRVRCGLAIEAIGPRDHTQLMSLLNRSKDDNAYSNQAVDLESLWKFFFKTGFIYPKKFLFMQAEKETIKATFEKLYSRNASISRHFIYQDKGAIVGHVAMLHVYAGTWMIHHHAASPSQSIKAGINVLGQLNRYIFEFCRFEPVDMQYMMCYYRPDNRFPERAFGGVCRYIKDANQCSLDSLAYLFLRREAMRPCALPADWRIEPATAEDFAAIRTTYQRQSDGLLIDGLDISPDSSGDQRLSEEYRRLDIMRQRYFISLKKEGRLQALFMIALADPGLNFSSLTRCIHVLVADPQNLPAAVLLEALGQVGSTYFKTDIPVLIYPSTYADRHSIAYERHYTLWIIRSRCSDAYFRYFRRLSRFF